MLPFHSIIIDLHHHCTWKHVYNSCLHAELKPSDPHVFFLANFSLLEICYVSGTSPKMLSVLLSQDKTSQSLCMVVPHNSLVVCCWVVPPSVTYLQAWPMIGIMIYVTPLLYNSIMNKIACRLLLLGSYLMGVLSAVTHTSPGAD
ncbi:unnamed protein product [Staurois parvus]|uniref:Uncharacterized protein n=1 Tax=Staurois parvus TaxID=386267 RepID=A0ABN9DNQ1_9NEOB|nr:unnamed protein product [Staurois parvus]